MAHSHAFSPFASSAVPSFPPFSSPSVGLSSFFGVCWELVGETLRGVGVPSIHSRLWLSACSVLFRFPPSGSSGPVVASPGFLRAFFFSVRLGFPGGPSILCTRVPSGSSHGTVSLISRSLVRVAMGYFQLRFPSRCVPCAAWSRLSN